MRWIFSSTHSANKAWSGRPSSSRATTVALVSWALNSLPMQLYPNGKLTTNSQFLSENMVRIKYCKSAWLVKKNTGSEKSRSTPTYTVFAANPSVTHTTHFVFFFFFLRGNSHIIKARQLQKGPPRNTKLQPSPSSVKRSHRQGTERTAQIGRTEKNRAVVLGSTQKYCPITITQLYL
jgi:hypothetical protein